MLISRIQAKCRLRLLKWQESALVNKNTKTGGRWALSRRDFMNPCEICCSWEVFGCHIASLSWMRIRPEKDIITSHITKHARRVGIYSDSELRGLEFRVSGLDSLYAKDLSRSELFESRCMTPWSLTSNVSFTRQTWKISLGDMENVKSDAS